MSGPKYSIRRNGFVYDVLYINIWERGSLPVSLICWHRKCLLSSTRNLCQSITAPTHTAGNKHTTPSGNEHDHVAEKAHSRHVDEELKQKLKKLQDVFDEF